MGDQDMLKMQQRKDFLIKFCYWAVIAVCIYAVFKYLLPLFFLPLILIRRVDSFSGRFRRSRKPLCRRQRGILAEIC